MALRDHGSVATLGARVVLGCATVAALLTGSCSSHGIVTEDSFLARTDAEREAKVRMRHWAGVAEALLDMPELHDDGRASIRASIATMRSALTAYEQLRTQGSARVMVIAPIQASAVAIVADDVTVAGIADDIALAPLALAAIATYAVTDARATQDELALSWNQVLSTSGELAETIETAMLAASLGSRQECIEQYVDCQQNARRGFPRHWCQFCMDKCIVQGFRWPKLGECDYK